MTKVQLLSAALTAAAMLATPAVARTNHVTSRHRRARDAYASASPTAHVRAAFSAPRVGAPPPENCDVGDDPHIC
jgi:hypothetical protein